MADDTNTIPNKVTVETKSETLSTLPLDPQNDESRIGTVSIRSIIAMTLILSVCVLAFMSIPIPSVVSDLSVAISSFYFGHSVGKSSK